MFLFGGNDGNNMVVPISTPDSNPAQFLRQLCGGARGLGVAAGEPEYASTLPRAMSTGCIPSLAELAKLYNNKKNVAVLTNVGSLVTPLTQTEYLTADQSHPSKSCFRIWISKPSCRPRWRRALRLPAGAAALADAMQGCNTTGFPTIVSVGGNALFATGSQTNPATVTAGQVLGLQGFTTSAASQARLTALQNLLSFDNGLTLVQASNAIASNGVNQATVLNQALAGGTALTTVFPNTSLGTQMAQIAKIINVRATLGVQPADILRIPGRLRYA